MKSTSTQTDSFILDLQKNCFSHLGFSIPEKETMDLYKMFDEICEVITEGPYEAFHIDYWMEQFAHQANNPVANGKILLKNIPNNLFALSDHLENKPKQFDVMSYQYVPGIYEFISEKVSLSKGLRFLKLMSEYHGMLEEKLEGVLSYIKKKVACRTMLKIWRHRPVEGQHCFHPLHHDRSIFSALIHNTKAQSLKLFTPQKDKFYYPQPQDYPFLITGGFAKEFFDLESIPHTVETSNDINSRHSLVFFITDPKKWEHTEGYIPLPPERPPRKTNY